MQNSQSSLRLLFPSLPESLEAAPEGGSNFGSAAIGFDVVGLGVLTDPTQLSSASVVTKNVTLRLTGGLRGRVFAEPPWLAPTPERFINPQGTGELKINLGVRRDASQGAGLLPGQANWGLTRLSLNGAVFDYGAVLIVGSKVPGDQGGTIFALHRQVVARLDQQGDVADAITTPAHPNAASFALGLITDYLGENHYNNRMPEATLVERIAETLADRDYNADGWAGFTQQDVLAGAPGWALGRKIN